MRKFLLLISFIVFVAIVFFSLKTIKQKVRNDLYTPLDSYVTVSPTIFPTIDIKKNPGEKQLLFVPYWTISASEILPEQYDTVIYFGVTPTEDGINTSEAGYTTMPTFLKRTAQWKKHLLTLRMLDNKVNFAILENESNQDKLIRDVVQTADENGFDGIVLDLEVTALPFDSVITQINGFTKKLSVAAKKADLSFGMMVYGDTFYRVRPFEVKTLGMYTDQLYIMAYDFTKAKGNPGPNFPLNGKDTFGYDYTTLVANFTQVISPKKLTVVFGMYGYDWIVDDKNISTGVGEAMSTNKIEKSIITNCLYLSCTWERDRDAGEIKARYEDNDKAHHIVWYEDLDSVNRKKEFLKKQGISSYAFWAYSYF